MCEEKSFYKTDEKIIQTHEGGTMQNKEGFRNTALINKSVQVLLISFAQPYCNKQDKFLSASKMAPFWMELP